MPLLLAIVVTLIAFAANSVINRMAVAGGLADPGSFATIRVTAGALVLVALARAQGRAVPLRSVRRIAGAGSLAVYMVGFSVGYLTLDAGIGALLLFGVVQVAIFGISAWRGAAPNARQIAGAAVAMAGLAVVLWPAGVWRVDAVGALCMVAAGIGWAVYTLEGRGEPDALAGTAANFVWALPPTALALGLDGVPVAVTPSGVGLAVISGALTSGLGYALWYRVLPRISAVTAAVAMVAVPLIAVAGGIVFLGESVTQRFAIGVVLVLGGILLAIRRA
ncbi:MAG: DMT family transporter [Pseudooceanicola sp.]|nr:DMT family transporter [Pseudooceanicola sp.]